jgi:hypothetical protein
MRKTIHEMRNQLAVAVANIEAIMDGKLAPTPDRLASVLNALSKLDILMNELPTATKPLQTMPNMQPVDVCALIASETVAIEARPPRASHSNRTAASKSIRLARASRVTRRR